MKSSLPSYARDLIAFVIVALACPIAVFGGANIGCVRSTDFSGSCAATVIFVSPLLLFLGGTLAGVTTSGWTGLLVTVIGMVTGMTAILFVSMFAGQPVPVDWFSAVAATFFFGVPILAGYGFGRVLTRLFARRAH